MGGEMSKFTVEHFFARKKEGQKITMVTAYDYLFSKIVEEAGIEVILVGDSLGIVVQGHENTLPVSMDEMIYHTRLVSRAAQKAMVIGDMPFMSYQTGVVDAVRNAGRFLKEAGATAVKMEGGIEVIEYIRAMTKSDIPVMGHIGLTPQSIHRMGGYRVQGKTREAAERLLEEAHMVEDAGAFALLLEAVPMDLAKKITERLKIPVIGIGAGPFCDGQVLVLHDVIGLFDRFIPKFVKRYADTKDVIMKALQSFKKEVEKGIFPSESESFK